MARQASFLLLIMTLSPFCAMIPINSTRYNSGNVHYDLAPVKVAKAVTTKEFLFYVLCIPGPDPGPQRPWPSPQSQYLVYTRS